MSNASADFAASVGKVLEVVMFENWLRFYFINAEKEEDTPEGEEKLFILVPEQGVERIQSLYPHLYPMLSLINGKEVTFDSSRAAVCEHVLTELDGKTIPKEMSGTVFDSTTFQVELQLFNMWVQAHEEQLDEGFLEFGAWQNFFSQWRQSEGVKDVALKMMSAANAQSTEQNAEQGTETTQ